MPDILDNYIKKVHTFQISNKISNYYHKIIIRKNRFLKLIVIRFEIFNILFSISLLEIIFNHPQSDQNLVILV